MNEKNRGIFQSFDKAFIEEYVANYSIHVSGSWGNGDAHELEYHVGTGLYVVTVYGEVIGAHPDAAVALKMFLDN